MNLSGLPRYLSQIESMIPVDLAISVLVDRSRPVYQSLVIYSQLLKMDSSAKVDEKIRDSITAMDESIWSSLILRVAGELFEEPTWIERSKTAFEKLVAHQQPNGAFLPPDNRINPETRWYDEMMLLHAVASYAVRVRDASIDSAVARSAQFHLDEIQPDHATAEPWGLLAFIQYAPPLADQVLHSLCMQYPQGVTGVPLLLLRDVRYGLRRIARGTP
jgi:hypothetical protein